ISHRASGLDQQFSRITNFARSKHKLPYFESLNHFSFKYAGSLFLICSNQYPAQFPNFFQQYRVFNSATKMRPMPLVSDTSAVQSFSHFVIVNVMTEIEGEPLEWPLLLQTRLLLRSLLPIGHSLLP